MTSRWVTNSWPDSRLLVTYLLAQHYKLTWITFLWTEPNIRHTIHGNLVLLHPQEPDRNTCPDITLVCKMSKCFDKMYKAINIYLEKVKLFYTKLTLLCHGHKNTTMVLIHSHEPYVRLKYCSLRSKEPMTPVKIQTLRRPAIYLG